MEDVIYIIRKGNEAIYLNMIFNRQWGNSPEYDF
jgi:hypothetical protein